MSTNNIGRDQLAIEILLAAISAGGQKIDWTRPDVMAERVYDLANAMILRGLLTGTPVLSQNSDAGVNVDVPDTEAKAVEPPPTPRLDMNYLYKET